MRDLRDREARRRGRRRARGSRRAAPRRARVGGGIGSSPRHGSGATGRVSSQLIGESLPLDNCRETGDAWEMERRVGEPEEQRTRRARAGSAGEPVRAAADRRRAVRGRQREGEGRSAASSSRRSTSARSTSVSAAALASEQRPGASATSRSRNARRSSSTEPPASVRSVSSCCSARSKKSRKATTFRSGRVGLLPGPPAAALLELHELGPLTVGERRLVQGEQTGELGLQLFDSVGHRVLRRYRRR